MLLSPAKAARLLLLARMRVAGGPGSGNFGHAGRPGEVGGSSSIKSAANDVANELWTVSGGVETMVDAHPNAVRAAKEMVPVIREMKQAGYDMPSMFLVLPDTRTRVEDEHVHGMVSHVTKKVDGIQIKNRTLVIDVPGSLPSDVSLDQAVFKTYGQPDATGNRRFVSTTFRDVIVHEMGHVQFTPTVDGQAFLDELAAVKEPFFTTAAKQVSNYATTNPDEFIAEAFSFQLKGGVLPPEAAKAYAALRGPKIRKAA